MPITNGYASLDAVKRTLGITGTQEDADLEDIITGSSRALDQWLGRRFYAATETRYLTPVSGDCLRLDQDLRTVTTLKSDEDGDRTFEITWSATTDYYLDPPNASADGKPYRRVIADTVNGAYRFPCRFRGVEIVGSWGYCATGSHPPMIGRACLLLVARLYKRGDAPLGITGSQEMGYIRLGTDRDIQDLIWPYNINWGVA